MRLASQSPSEKESIQLRQSEKLTLAFTSHACILFRLTPFVLTAEPPLYRLYDLKVKITITILAQNITMMFFLQSEQFDTGLSPWDYNFPYSPLSASPSKYYNINEKGKNHVITLTLSALVFIILVRM